MRTWATPRMHINFNALRARCSLSFCEILPLTWLHPISTDAYSCWWHRVVGARTDAKIKTWKTRNYERVFIYCNIENLPCKNGWAADKHQPNRSGVVRKKWCESIFLFMQLRLRCDNPARASNRAFVSLEYTKTTTHSSSNTNEMIGSVVDALKLYRFALSLDAGVIFTDGESQFIAKVIC